MSNAPNNSERVNVAFSFYTGQAGLSRQPNSRDAIVACRPDHPVRGAVDAIGTVGGETVEVGSVTKSPVPGYVRVEVRFPEGEAA